MLIDVLRIKKQRCDVKDREEVRANNLTTIITIITVSYTVVLQTKEVLV